VKLGQRQGDEIVVTEGITPNERVVLAGQMLIRPGGKVRVSANSQAEATSSGASGKASVANGGQL
jgi:hypothetical protein